MSGNAVWENITLIFYDLFLQETCTCMISRLTFLWWRERPVGTQNYLGEKKVYLAQTSRPQSIVEDH